MRAQQGDRFMPDRSAMDMEMAHYLLTVTEPKKDKDNAAGMAASPCKEAYWRHGVPVGRLERIHV